MTRAELAAMLPDTTTRGGAREWIPTWDLLLDELEEALGQLGPKWWNVHTWANSSAPEGPLKALRTRREEHWGNLQLGDNNAPYEAWPDLRGGMLQTTIEIAAAKEGIDYSDRVNSYDAAKEAVKESAGEAYESAKETTKAAAEAAGGLLWPIAIGLVALLAIEVVK